MPRPAIQLYTLRDLDRSYEALLDAVAAAGFEGVEFAYRVRDHDPSAVSGWLDAAGLVPVAAHVPVDDLDESFDETVAFFEAVGCSTLVVPHLPPSAFDDVETARATGRRLSALAERLAERGLELAYHNHEHEFAVDGAFEAFVESAAGVAIEFDVGLATRAGEDPVAWLDRLAGRLGPVHLTDTVLGDDSRRHATLGTGDVDVPAVATAASDAGAAWLVYENGVTDDPVTELDRAGETLPALARR